MQVPASADAPKKPNGSPISPAGSENEISANKSSLQNTISSSSDREIVITADALRSLEISPSEGGRLSTDIQEEIPVGMSESERKVAHQENPSSNNDGARDPSTIPTSERRGGSTDRVFTGNITTDKEKSLVSKDVMDAQSGINMSDPVSDVSTEELKKAIAVDPSSENSTKDEEKRSGDDNKDSNKPKSVLAQSMEAPSPATQAEIVNRLLSLRGSNSQRIMAEIVDICHNQPDGAVIVYHTLASDVGHMSFGRFLVELAQYGLSLYESSGDPSYLDRALGFLASSKDVVESASKPSPVNDRHQIYIVEGKICHRRYERLGHLGDIERAIGAWKLAMDIIRKDDHSTKALLLSNRGNSLLRRFERLGDIDDLNNAVLSQQQAVDLTPIGHPDKATRLNNLGNSLQTRFQRQREIADLDKAIFTQQHSVELTPDGHPGKPPQLGNLGVSLLIRFECLGDIGDLNNAVLSQQLAVNLMPDGNANKPSLLTNLGNSLLTRFQRLGGMDDINNAVLSQQRAADLMPDGHPSKPALLSNLGNSLSIRFKHLGDMHDLKNAVASQQQAVDLMPDGYVSKPSWLNNLGNSLNTQFKHLGEIADLNNAVHIQQQAVNLTPDGHADKPSWLNNLGNSLLTRFERLGTIDDLDNAILNQRQAVNLTADRHATKPSLLNNLGNSFLARFQRQGEIDDLNNAILNQQKAVDLTPDGHPDKPSWMSNLGSSLQSRFQRLGEVVDLDKAVLIQQQSVYLTPEKHPYKASRLNNLGTSLRLRFERLEEISDLNNSVLAHQQAVDLTPDEYVYKPSLLTNLGNSLLIRHRWLGEASDLNNAVLSQRKAVNLTPEGHAEKPARLNNLANSLVRLFEHSKDMDDLNNAVLSQKQAVDLTPDGHADKAFWLNDLGRLLRIRFEQLGEVSDIDDSVRDLQQAVDLTPDEHAYKPSWLINLAHSLRTRFLHLRDPQDIRTFFYALDSSTKHQSGPPSKRFTVASWIATLLHPRPEPYQKAINLIPQIVWLGKTIEKRYTDLQTLGEVVMDAVSAACEGGSYDLALEWIEQGRSIIWGQILQLRPPTDKLRVDHPDLANELHRIASALEIAGITETAPGESFLSPELEEASQAHRRLAEEWEDTLDTIRALPDFSDFLKPTPASVLKHASSDRTIVMVNVSMRRSDALILQPGSPSIVHVHLKSLSVTKVNEALDKLIKALHLSGVRVRDSADRGTSQKKATSGAVHNILKMLWVDVAKPILDHLGYTSPPPTGNLPHFTWCLTGALSILPLHAAGIYTSPDADNKLFNYVVSSYTPSLASLIEGLERTPTTPTARSLLAITQQNTPNLSSLPATMREVDKVKTLIEKHGISLTRMDGDQATVKNVSEAMNTHSWIHLACHGNQDAVKPTKSAFSLHDGELELREIMKKPLEHAEMAYLSACKTASGHAELPNEAIHLAAGMFTAGYRTVVATLWSIRDSDAPVVAQEFYDRLLSNPDGGAARALHEAVGVLRGQVGEQNLLAWVPYIHIGC